MSIEVQGLERELRQKWAEMQVPLISGICRPDCEVQWVNLRFDLVDGRYCLEREEEFGCSLRQLQEEEQLKWVFVAELARARSQDGQLLATAGCGMMGADGYVALLSNGDSMYAWLAFFESSNPFAEIEFEGAGLVATSSLGDKWSFPLANPEKFKIQHGIVTALPTRAEGLP